MRLILIYLAAHPGLIARTGEATFLVTYLVTTEFACSRVYPLISTYRRRVLCRHWKESRRHTANPCTRASYIYSFKRKTSFRTPRWSRFNHRRRNRPAYQNTHASEINKASLRKGDLFPFTRDTWRNFQVIRIESLKYLSDQLWQGRQFKCARIWRQRTQNTVCNKKLLKYIFIKIYLFYCVYRVLVR